MSGRHKRDNFPKDGANLSLIPALDGLSFDMMGGTEQLAVSAFLINDGRPSNIVLGPCGFICILRSISSKEPLASVVEGNLQVLPTVLNKLTAY